MVLELLFSEGFSHESRGEQLWSKGGYGRGISRMGSIERLDGSRNGEPIYLKRNAQGESWPVVSYLDRDGDGVGCFLDWTLECQDLGQDIAKEMVGADSLSSWSRANHLAICDDRSMLPKWLQQPMMDEGHIEITCDYAMQQGLTALAGALANRRDTIRV